MTHITLNEILFTVEIKTKNIKNSYLRVKANNHLLVTCPKRMTEDEVFRFIKGAEHKLLKYRDMSSKKPLYPHDRLIIFDVTYPLVIKYSLQKKLFLNQGVYYLNSPSSDLDVSLIERHYQKILIDRASQMINDMSYDIKREYRLSSVSLKAQKMKTQLGSCHVQKRIIKLNTLLVRLPEDCLFAILCHEIVHLKISGHQADFYRELEKLVPDYRTQRKAIRSMISEYEV